MERERIQSSKSSNGSTRPTSSRYPSRSRRNLKLAIPNRLLKAGGAQDTIKQRRVQRRKAKFQSQVFRLMLVIVPLGFTLVFTEQMRQRALNEYIKDVETEVNSIPNANVHDYANQTGALSVTLRRYPFNGIANVTSPIDTSQTGFFWQIPRTGGSTLKDIFGKCLYLVQASRTSAEVCNTNANEKELKICKSNLGAYVNCDPSDDHGIQRCRDLNLVPSGMADVVVSSRFLHTASMFDAEHQARAFTIMRDPIERMISTFYYLHNATWEREYSKEMKNKTLLDYAKSVETPSNWMVRFLTGRMTKATMTADDLALAKEILEKKFFVIPTKEMNGGVHKLIKHMKYKVSDEGRQCIKEEVDKMTTRLNHPRVDMSSPAVEMLREKNKLDVELYDHAMKVFARQWTAAE
mmetsp:Transcript_4774/g.7232  ORF Transcript_4774/g.7232 Transcript_4774/m.7232 type:complete len:408 (-) Transcript_4774:59-1282(-)